MSVRCEWHYAPASYAELLIPGEAAPDGQIDHEYTLVIGSDNPACFTGTKAQLEDLLRNGLAQVRGES